jgi:hypothetical protein
MAHHTRLHINISKLVKELSKLIKHLLYNGLFEITQIQNVFAASNLQPNLKNLMSKLLCEKVGTFKQNLIDNESKNSVN